MNEVVRKDDVALLRSCEARVPAVNWYNAANKDMDEEEAMGGSKATEEELRALVARDSSITPALEAAMYEP